MTGDADPVDAEPADADPTDADLEVPSDGLDAAEQRAAVRERYGRIASESGSCCGGGDAGCGDDAAAGTGDDSAEHARSLGYDDADLDAVDVAANLGLGCGNPTAIAELEPGQTVLDLGSGAGFDCFLAAEAVGPSGRVIGVDMTPEMVERAREHAAERDAARDDASVEFRLGEIEHLPVPDATVDVILSNCVVNLSPDEPRVFEEAYRVLRPGGRLAISDVVLTAEPPAEFEPDPESVAACVGGASSIPHLEATLDDAGFVDVAVEPADGSEAIVREWDDEHDLAEYLAAATIEGRKPAE